jgi:hypothetical protein
MVLGAVLVLFAVGCGGGTLSAKALSQQATTLQSLASEGGLLAQDAVSGKTTRVFTRVHASDLAKAASQGETSLKAAKTTPSLEPKLRGLVKLAGQVSADLKRLGKASKDEQRMLGRELQSAAQAAKKIGAGK